MSQQCAIDGCKRLSRALCHCCQENICIVHLSEHSDLLNSQLNPLADEINILGDRLNSLNIQQKTIDSRQKLEQWRMESHEKIEQFYQEKSQELDRCFTEKVEKQQQEIIRMQSILTKLIREQEATRQDINTLTEDILRIQQEIKKIEQNSIHMNVRPLPIDVDCIRIYDRNDNELDFATLSPPCKTIRRTNDTSRVLTSNDHYLLFHDAPNLCLIDRNLTLVTMTFWPHGNITDMCWSSTLNQFIVVEASEIYFINQNTLVTESIERIRRERWMSCTCSDTSLFLSTRVHGSSVVEMNLLPRKTIVREWKSPQSCAPNEDITCIGYNKETLALLIRNDLHKTMKMDLKSSVTFNCFWSLPLDTGYSSNKTLRFCSLIDDEWLIADHERSRLIHISKDGRVKTTVMYDEIPWFVNLFGSNILAVSIKKHRLNFHEIKNQT